MKNCPFTDDLPIRTSIYKGSSMAMLNNQLVMDFIHPLVSFYKWKNKVNDVKEQFNDPRHQKTKSMAISGT